MARVIRGAAAKRDLTNHFAYLGEHASIDVAERFLQAAGQSLQRLAQMPGMGIPGKVQRGKFAGVRLWPINGFGRYIIVYRPLKDGVQVERVIHSAQDYQHLLGR